MEITTVIKPEHSARNKMLEGGKNPGKTFTLPINSIATRSVYCKFRLSTVFQPNVLEARGRTQFCTKSS